MTLSRSGKEIIDAAKYVQSTIDECARLSIRDILTLVDEHVSATSAGARQQTYLGKVTSCKLLDSAIRASAENSDGVMIALVPSESDLDKLAVDGREPRESIHLTLMYLGKTDTLALNPDDLIMSVAQRVSGISQISANVFGVSTFNPLDNPAIVLNVGDNDNELMTVHTMAEMSARDVLGDSVRKQHSPFVAHITLGYTLDPDVHDAAMDRLGPITFDKVRVAYDDQVTDIPLARTGDVMPYKVVRSEQCEDSKPYAVVKEGSGEVMGCHDTAQSAFRQLRALYAAEPSLSDATESMEDHQSYLDVGMASNTEIFASDVDTITNIPWTGVLVVEGRPTGDGRTFAPGSLTWANLPEPFQWQPSSLPGHEGAVISGMIENIWRDPEDMSIIRGSGIFDMVGNGFEVHRMVHDGFLKGVSVDVDDVSEADIEYVFAPSVGDGPPILENKIIHSGRIRGATVVALPAFVESQINCVHEVAMTASAVLPSRSYFEDPKFDGPTPVTVTDDGRISGHAAIFGTCHTGIQGVCVQPPYEDAHEYYRLGSVLTDAGEVATGTITMDTGHASTYGVDAEKAVAHYDNTGTVVADVASGCDDYGIWISGKIRPDVPDTKVSELRAAKLSGDWRGIKGALRLVAMLAVNVPGFPVPRLSTMVASGQQTALVAAGIWTHPAEEPVDVEIITDNPDTSSPLDSLTPAQLAMFKSMTDDYACKKRDNLAARMKESVRKCATSRICMI